MSTARTSAAARTLCADLRRHWWLTAVVGAIWALALVRLFGDHVPRLPLLVNWTPSLPYLVVWADYRPREVRRGDLVVYTFTGPAAREHYPGLGGQPFFKRVAGVEGDVVSVVGREVLVNGVSAGIAKTHAFDRRPLAPIEPGAIPPGKVYVMGTGPDSFDSRYLDAGLVDVATIVAVVHPLF